MSEFVLAYTGGGMKETPEEQAETMAAWGAWYGSIGEDLVDGGAPFAASSTICSDGAVSEGGTSALTGYTVVKADAIDGALAHAKGCPILSDGGSVEVYEKIDMAM